jgi:hypothetical protein
MFPFQVSLFSPSSRKLRIAKRAPIFLNETDFYIKDRWNESKSS